VGGASVKDANDDLTGGTTGVLPQTGPARTVPAGIGPRAARPTIKPSCETGTARTSPSWPTSTTRRSFDEITSPGAMSREATSTDKFCDVDANTHAPIAAHIRTSAIPASIHAGRRRDGDDNDTTGASGARASLPFELGEGRVNVRAINNLLAPAVDPCR
jgi:hypothetical protein